MLRVFFIWTVAITVLVATVAVLAWHWDYYGLARPQRPLHDDHSTLRPSGTVGLSSGIIGMVLFVLNLGYLVRRQLVTVPGLGSLRSWMDAHVLTGLTGACLIALHSAMAPASALGTLAVVAMTVTVATGIIGRTIYMQIPRSLEGRELELGQVQDQLNVYRTQLEQSEVRVDWLHPGPRPHTVEREKGLIDCFRAMIMGDRQRRQDYQRLRQRVLGSAQLRPLAKDILPLAKAFCIHWQWLTRYRQLCRLIASWRFFHRWLAVAMFCAVLGHIVVALWFGDVLAFGAAQ
jgi:hypothetical protein